MKKLVSMLAFAIILGACGEVAPPKKPETVIEHRDLDSEVIKTVAKMSIGGMMCAEGCGGKIQQDLRALPGVVFCSPDGVRKLITVVQQTIYRRSTVDGICDNQTMRCLGHSCFLRCC